MLKNIKRNSLIKFVKMEGINKVNKYWQHFKTITKHRHKVMWLCFRIKLYKQGLLHDLSKYSPIEFFTSAKYYQGTSSPIDAEKNDKGYSLAWLHHKGHNPHHWEYWVDNLGPQPVNVIGIFKPSFRNSYREELNKDTILETTEYQSRPDAIDMPHKYILEMVCDMVAAGQVYLGDKWTNKSPLEFYEKNKNHMLLSYGTKRLLEHWLNAIANEGLKSFIMRARIWK